MSNHELSASTISGLVDYFGGFDELALILKVNVDDLQRWSEGKARPPANVFSCLMHAKPG